MYFAFFFAFTRMNGISRAEVMRFLGKCVGGKILLRNVRGYSSLQWNLSLLKYSSCYMALTRMKGKELVPFYYRTPIEPWFLIQIIKRKLKKILTIIIKFLSEKLHTLETV